MRKRRSRKRKRRILEAMRAGGTEEASRLEQVKVDVSGEEFRTGDEDRSRVTKVVDQYGVYLPLKSDPSEEERAEKKQGGRVRGRRGGKGITDNILFNDFV